MNTISQKQLTKKQLDRLAAQRQLYSDAKRVQALHMTLSVPFIVAWAVFVAWFPSFKIYVACWGILITLLDIILFTPWQRSLKHRGAKIQELFDCDVLQISWSDIKVGPRPDTELIMESSSKFKCVDPECSTLRNWYPIEVKKLPIHLARIVCQRTNCWWDAKLRRRYAIWVLAVVSTLTVLVFLIGLIGGLTLEELILAVVVPLMPAFTLGIRQYNEHNEAAATVDRLKEHSERLWNKAITGEATPEELAIASRDLQDEIYDHRRKSPLIFDWIYRRLRKTYEEQMNKAAGELVKEALQ